MDMVRESCGGGTEELWYSDFGITGVVGSGPYWGVYAVLPFATHSPPLQFLPPQVGQSWTDSGTASCPAGVFPINSMALVVSLTETITVPAGSFSNCAKVEETLSYPLGYSPCGLTPVAFERWFSPGIGPVKFVVTDSDGVKYTGELTAFQLTSTDPSDYFPLGLNDTWTFTMDTLQTTSWVVSTIVVWPDLSNGLAGTHGIPELQGYGTLFAGANAELSLCCALENTTAALVIGLSNLSAPFKGGVLVPNPDVVTFPLWTGADGEFDLQGEFPLGTPPGLTLYFQIWINDPVGPQGWAASNAISGTTP